MSDLNVNTDAASPFVNTDKPLLTPLPQCPSFIKQVLKVLSGPDDHVRTLIDQLEPRSKEEWTLELCSSMLELRKGLSKRIYNSCLIEGAQWSG